MWKWRLFCGLYLLSLPPPSPPSPPSPPPPPPPTHTLIKSCIRPCTPEILDEKQAKSGIGWVYEWEVLVWLSMCVRQMQALANLLAFRCCDRVKLYHAERTTPRSTGSRWTGQQAYTCIVSFTTLREVPDFSTAGSLYFHQLFYFPYIIAIWTRQSSYCKRYKRGGGRVGCQLWFNCYILSTATVYTLWKHYFHTSYLSVCPLEIQSLCRVYGKRNAEGSRWMVNVVIFRDDKECKNVSTRSVAKGGPRGPAPPPPPQA